MLEDNIALTKVKIERAEKLISGLGGEKERWTMVRTISLFLLYSKRFKHYNMITLMIV